MDQSDEAARVVGILGIVTSIVVTLAPVRTFYSIYKNKSTGEFQCFPYILMDFGAWVWIYHAYQLDNVLLIAINFLRVFIATVYILIFLWYATTRMSIVKQLLCNLVVGALVFFAQLIIKNEATRVKILGCACVIYSIAAFAAPLCVIRQVRRTKSVEFMPFELLFFFTINAVTWSVYGSLLKDRYIQIPNFLGIALGTAQLVLFYMTYHNSEEAVKGETLPEHASEMTRSSGTGNNHNEATNIFPLQNNLAIISSTQVPRDDVVVDVVEDNVVNLSQK